MGERSSESRRAPTSEGLSGIRPRPAGGWVRRSWPLLVRCRRHLVGALVAALAGTAASVAGPIVLRDVVDAAVARRGGGLPSGVLTLAVLAVVRFVAASGRRWFAGRVSLDAENQLRDALFVHLQRLGPAGPHRFGLGQLVSRAGADARAVQMLLAFLPLVLGNIVLLVLSLVAMSLLSPPLTIVALLILPGLVVVSVRMRRRTFPAAWDVQERSAEVASVVEEAVSGARVVKAFTAEERELARLEGTAARLYASRMRLARMQARYTWILQVLPSLGLALMLLASGRLALDGRLSLGTFLAFNSYLLQLAAPARMVSVLAAVAQSARAGAERILEVLDTEPPVAERPDARPLPAGTGRIVFEDVHLSLEPGRPVLRGFGLTVEAGERVALVGPSGSGKTTAALLLARFQDPERGRVLLDGADVRDLRLAELRSAVGVVFQEPFLFAASVLDNVAYGRPGASEEEVRAAVWAAGAAEIVDSLPDGYGSTVGERGVTLSGGQRQRLTLARAVLARPRVVVLDDATSAVDPELEATIHDRLGRHLSGRTALVVAHRHSTLRLVDRVALVEEGRVVATGPHEELLATCPAYRRLLGAGADGLAGDELAGDELAEGESGTAGSAPGRVAPGAPPRGPLEGASGFGASWAAVTLSAAGRRVSGEALAAQVAALPPARDEPGLTLEEAASPDPGFGLAGLARAQRGPLLAAVLLVALDAAITLVGPALVRLGVDRGVLGGSWPALVGAAGAYLGVVALHGWVLWAQAVRTGILAERVLYGSRVRVFAHLQRLGLDFYDREPAGRVMSRMTSDVDSLAQLFQQALASLAVNVALALGVAVVLLLVQPTLAGVALASLVPLVAMTAWFRERSGRAHLEVRERVAAVAAALQEGVSGAHVAQAFGQEAATVAAFRRVSGEHLAARLVANRLAALFFPAVEALGALAVAAVVGVGVGLIREGSLSPGELIAFVLYLNLLFGPLQHLSQSFDVAQQAGAATVKLRALLATAALPEQRTGAAPPPGAGHLRLAGVRFRYPGAGGWALDGIDLEVPAGETLALVGPTGAGKSTIVKLLARVHDPDEGAVRLDGVDLRHLDLRSYRRLLGVVPQEAHLMRGTVGDNIAYGRPAASQAEREAAARAVGAHEAILRLPQGYGTDVGEGGRRLAAGERQLVALARARLVDPRVLLLDEATSSLDPGSEGRVRRAMAAAASGRTTVVVAHRLSTAAAAHRVAVVEGGRIVEAGSHEELLARPGRYRAMWEAWEGAGGDRPDDQPEEASGGRRSTRRTRKPSSMDPSASPMIA